MCGLGVHSLLPPTTSVCTSTCACAQGLPPLPCLPQRPAHRWWGQGMEPCKHLVRLKFLQRVMRMRPRRQVVGVRSGQQQRHAHRRPAHAAAAAQGAAVTGKCPKALLPHPLHGRLMLEAVRPPCGPVTAWHVAAPSMHARVCTLRGHARQGPCQQGALAGMAVYILVGAAAFETQWPSCGEGGREGGSQRLPLCVMPP